MAPTTNRRHVPKERFSAAFSTLKPQPYHDPTARGTASYNSLRSLSFSPLGTLIATGSRSLRVWNTEKPSIKFSTELKGHTGTIERLAFNKTKEAELASVSTDGTLKLWDVRQRQCTGSVPLGGEGLTVTYSADGENLVVGRKDDVLLPMDPRSLPTTTPTPLPMFARPLQTNQVIFPHIWGTPKRIFLTYGDGTVAICSYPDMVTLQTLHAHTSSCTSIALSPTARHLAIGSSDSLVSIWDTTNWICQKTFAGMSISNNASNPETYGGVASVISGGIKSVGFSFDGAYVIGGSDEGDGIEIGHVDSGEYVHRAEAPKCNGLVAWHPNRYWVAWAGDGGLRVIGAGVGSM